MVYRMCVACNSILMTDSCRSCACGHVFEDRKQIGGKRFSEYRAELYTRLENRREKQLKRQKRLKANETETGPQPLKERKINVEDSTILPSGFEPKNYTFSSKKHHRKIKGKKIHRPSPSQSTVPPELVPRLSSALQEINRRLTGQNMIWWMMQLN